MTSQQHPGSGSPLVTLSAGADVLRHPEAGEHLLTEAERGRAAAFRIEAARTDYLAAHILVRLCAGRLLGLPADRIVLAQECPDCGRSDHGRPFLPDHPEVHVSLSHTRGVVAAAAGPGPIGVDVELAGRGSVPEVLQRVLTPAELRLVEAHPEPGRAFLRQWVRKEALIKIGRAALDTLARTDLSALPLDVPPGEALHSRYLDLHLLDWTEGATGPAEGAVLAAVAAEPPRLVPLGG
ncbi:4'-phosphopantetheinyl transferase family protein [Kitasatospora sp. NPDC054939]